MTTDGEIKTTFSRSYTHAQDHLVAIKDQQWVSNYVKHLKSARGR